MSNASPRVPHPTNITAVDLTTLVYNTYQGARETDVGYEHAKLTIEEFAHRLNKIVTIRTEDLEAALWSCNLMNERAKFWDGKERTFEEFLKSVSRGKKFDLTYNYFKGDH